MDESYLPVEGGVLRSDGWQCEPILKIRNVSSQTFSIETFFTNESSVQTLTYRYREGECWYLADRKLALHLQSLLRQRR